MITANSIDALLPQTQCGECGYPGCMPYAQALAAGLAPIDRCPPGGVETVQALAKLLDCDATPYLEAAAQNTRQPARAHIRELECIGCTKCIQACPIDAIVGSAKLMHSIVPHECTGCGLCVEPCPVDCIELTPIPKPDYDPEVARQRFNTRHVRLLRDEQDKSNAYREKRLLAENPENVREEKMAKQNYILQAMQRSMTKKS